MEAADYAIARAEESVDRVIGRRARTLLARCCSAAILGAPIAWYVAGMHWNGIAFGGLAAGVALFAMLDAVRSSFRRRRDLPRAPE